jgi:hypothetical protein
MDENYQEVLLSVMNSSVELTVHSAIKCLLQARALNEAPEC